METTIFLAKFWGWYLMIFFIILSFNPIRIKQTFEHLKDQKFLILVAFIAIIIGLLNILFHNIWSSILTMVLSSIGWIALGKGLFLFAFPKLAVKGIEYANVKLVQVIYVLLLLVGLYLLNAGYQLIEY